MTLASCGQAVPEVGAQTSASTSTLRTQLLQPIDDNGGGGGGGGSYPPPVSYLTIPDGYNARVRVIMKSVYTSDTEDVMGADEFYFAGSLLATTPSNRSKAAPIMMSPPVDINDDQGISLNMVVFNEVVPKGTNVIGNLQAYDEDAAKDWGTVGPNFQQAVTTAANTLGSSGIKGAELLKGALNAGFQVLDASMKADKDDVLGNQGFEYISTNDEINRTYQMHMEKKGSFFNVSKWDYYIDYQIIVEPTKDQVTF